MRFYFIFRSTVAGLVRGLSESYHFNRTAVARPVLLDYNNTINGLLTRSTARKTNHKNTGFFPLFVYSTVRHPPAFLTGAGNRNQSSRSSAPAQLVLIRTLGMPVAPWRIRRIDSATDPTTKESPDTRPANTCSNPSYPGTAPYWQAISPDLAVSGGHISHLLANVGLLTLPYA